MICDWFVFLSKLCVGRAGGVVVDHLALYQMSPGSINSRNRLYIMQIVSKSIFPLAGFLRDLWPLKLGHCIVCYVYVGTPLEINLLT